MPDAIITKTPCPFCSTLQTGYMACDGSDVAPSDGAVCLCCECGEWGVWQNGRLIFPDDECYDGIAASDECRTARRVWMRLREADQVDEA